MLFSVNLVGLASLLVAVCAAKSSSASLSASASTSTPASSNATSSPAVVNSTVCNGQAYIYEELAGYGLIPSDARDKYGDTLGGYGSSIAFDKTTWRSENGSYTGILWAIPDRGWNTEGTLNYQNRVHKFKVTLTPNASATVEAPSGPNLQLQYLDTILFTDPSGTPLTGLDADADCPYMTFPDFPDLPSATYTGDGFGGNGTGGRRVSFDSEGLVLGADGSFWISDEYGPYVYKFDPTGRMTNAIRPADAFIPLRNGTESFSADSAPRYDPDLVVTPADNPSGRANNQGFEGLTVSPDGNTLYVLLQSAANQEGGLKKKNRRYARFVEYDISGSNTTYLAEYVVPLPLYSGSSVAGQSEIHYISDTQFLILARDSNAGHGQDDTESVYRHVDVFDISNATNVKSTANDAFNGSIASTTGKLNAGIRPAQYCNFLDFNVNSQLNRFGVHNGGASDAGLLNEKWESLALVPVNGNGDDGEYFLFSLSDNDFITQNGYMNFGQLPYADESGHDLDNQALVFRVKLPKDARPS